MSAGQYPQQCLIERADADIGEEGFFAIVGQPLAAMCSGCRLVFVVVVLVSTAANDRSSKGVGQSRGTVCEHQRRLLVCLKQLAVAVFAESFVHGVGGGHGGEAEIQPVGMAAGHQALRQQQGRLGFPGAGHVFENEQLWSIAQQQLFGTGLQRGGSDRFVAVEQRLQRHVARDCFGQ